LIVSLKRQKAHVSKAGLSRSRDKRANFYTGTRRKHFRSEKDHQNRGNSLALEATIFMLRAEIACVNNS
jgi:hypothetical protein